MYANLGVTQTNDIKPGVQNFQRWYATVVKRASPWKTK